VSQCESQEPELYNLEQTLDEIFKQLERKLKRQDIRGAMVLLIEKRETIARCIMDLPVESLGKFLSKLARISHKFYEEAVRVLSTIIFDRALHNPNDFMRFLNSLDMTTIQRFVLIDSLRSLILNRIDILKGFSVVELCGALLRIYYIDKSFATEAMGRSHNVIMSRIHEIKSLNASELCTVLHALNIMSKKTYIQVLESIRSTLESRINELKAFGFEVFKCFYEVTRGYRGIDPLFYKTLRRRLERILIDHANSIIGHTKLDFDELLEEIGRMPWRLFRKLIKAAKDAFSELIERVPIEELVDALRDFCWDFERYGVLLMRVCADSIFRRFDDVLMLPINYLEKYCCLILGNLRNRSIVFLRENINRLKERFEKDSITNLGRFLTYIYQCTSDKNVGRRIIDMIVNNCKNIIRDKISKMSLLELSDCVEKIIWAHVDYAEYLPGELRFWGEYAGYVVSSIVRLSSDIIDHLLRVGEIWGVAKLIIELLEDYGEHAEAILEIISNSLFSRVNDMATLPIKVLIRLLTRITKTPLGIAKELARRLLRTITPRLGGETLRKIPLATIGELLSVIHSHSKAITKDIVKNNIEILLSRADEFKNSAISDIGSFLLGVSKVAPEFAREIITLTHDDLEKKIREAESYELQEFIRNVKSMPNEISKILMEMIENIKQKEAET